MQKLKNLIPKENKKQVNEAVEDMEVALPARVEKFLERLISTIKSYNLTKKREQAVIARVIDSLGITPSQLTQTVQKLKKYDVVTRKKTGNADHDWMGENINEANDREEPTISLEDAVKAMEDALTFAKKLGKQIANKKGGVLTEKDLARVVDNFRYKYKDYSQNKFRS
jgi:phage shock protein A